VAIAERMTQQIEQFIQQPATPNLYWALATLPAAAGRSGGPGLEGEMESLYLNFPELQRLKQPDSPDLAADAWRELLFACVGELGQMGQRETGRGTFSWQVTGAALALSVQGYPWAKQLLVEHGRGRPRSRRCPSPRSFCCAPWHATSNCGDDCYKWMFLPYPEFQKGYARAESQVTGRAVRQQEILPIASVLLPAIGAAKNARPASSGTLAHLEIFEALRMYAAGARRQAARKAEPDYRSPRSRQSLRWPAVRVQAGRKPSGT